ncbi:MAG: hypothetical protein CVT92_02760 [Bacteroidetes bacterium HGW-Bacteroidetes-1]|jgi:hypothetical protein|nr:MAG: hypothetical protein CVT92_02760 [Bacteroidetes bacterium HGW-Bacteroidetes-1]
MAIVQNPITGRTRKKFGTAVFSKHYEQNTMRSRPKQVSNPRTEGQVLQRSKFAKIVDLIRQVLPFVNEAYATKLKNMSPFNKIVSINSKTVFFEGTSDIDYSKVQFCDNTGSTVSEVEWSCEDNQAINLAWNPNTVDPLELDSPVGMILVNTTQNKAIHLKNIALRSEASTIITAPIEWVGDVVAVYLITDDYTTSTPKSDGTVPQKKVVKFKPGTELSSSVK